MAKQTKQDRLAGKNCVVDERAAGTCVFQVEWAIYDTHRPGRPDRYACDMHLSQAIDRERGGLVVPAEWH